MFERYMDQLREIDWFYLSKIRKLDPMIVAKVAVMNLLMVACFWRWSTLVGEGEAPFSRLTIVVAVLVALATIVFFTMGEAKAQDKSPKPALVVRTVLLLIPTAALAYVLNLQEVRHDLSGGSIQAAFFAVAYVWLFGWDVKLAHPFHHMARVAAPQREARPMPRTDLSDSKDLAREEPVTAEIVEEPGPQVFPGGLADLPLGHRHSRTIYSQPDAG